MSKATLKLTKDAWLKYGKKKDDDVFPNYRRRLPELLQLCGTYPIGQSMPDWWRDFIQELKNNKWKWPLDVIELFESATPEEFKQGRFQIKRHKECRQRLPEHKKKIISSPRIGKFLEEQFGPRHQFTVAFTNRGAKLRKKEIVITADPWDVVNMSTRGKSWTSCQDFLKGDAFELWQNLSDRGMLIAFARTIGDESDKNMDTRVIIRYAQDYPKNSETAPRRGVIIDRFYGDLAYIPAMQRLILKLCAKHGLCLFEYEYYNSHQITDISYQINPGPKNDCFTVRGPSLKFPGELPYLDNSEWIEEKRKYFYHFEAKVCLIFAPSEQNTAV